MVQQTQSSTSAKAAKGGRGKVVPVAALGTAWTQPPAAPAVAQSDIRQAGPSSLVGRPLCAKLACSRRVSVLQAGPLCRREGAVSKASWLLLVEKIHICRCCQVLCGLESQTSQGAGALRLLALLE